MRHPDEDFCPEELELLYSKGFSWCGKELGGFSTEPWQPMVVAEAYKLGPRRLWCVRPAGGHKVTESPVFGTLEPLLVWLYIEGWI